MARRDAIYDISPEVLKNMTAAQLSSLQENVLADGKWDLQDEFIIRMDFETVMIRVRAGDSTTIVLGIEPDGYCHS